MSLPVTLFKTSSLSIMIRHIISRDIAVCNAKSYLITSHPIPSLTYDCSVVLWSLRIQFQRLWQHNRQLRRHALSSTETWEDEKRINGCVDSKKTWLLWLHVNGSHVFIEICDVANTGDTPCNRLRAGSTNKHFVTRQLTGLPGRPKKRTFPPNGFFSVANVAGLPGFMLIRPKWIVPNFSNIGLTKSASPMLT